MNKTTSSSDSVKVAEGNDIYVQRVASEHQAKAPTVLCVVDSVPSGGWGNQLRLSLRDRMPQAQVISLHNEEYPSAPQGYRIVFTDFVDPVTGVISVPEDAGTNVNASIHHTSNETVMCYINCQGEKIALVQRRLTGQGLFSNGVTQKRKQPKFRQEQNYLNLRKGWKK